MNKIKRLVTDRQFQLYSLIGLSGVAIDFIIYLVLVKIGIDPLFASFISVSIAIVNNFLLNRHYNFKRKDHTLQRFGSFYAVGLTGIALSIFFIYIVHTIFGLDAVMAKLISVPFIVIFQYWFNKNASFAVDHKSVPWKQIAIFSICISTVAIFAFNGPYHSFTDEDDNLLGAQFIAKNNGVIYKDYFSHHMPLTYFIVAPLFVYFDTDLVAIKVAFGILMSVWFLIMTRHLYKKIGISLTALFLFTVALSQMLTWSNMVLAETLIAFAIVHTLILFVTRKNRAGYKDVISLMILGSIPILSALSYAPLSISIYFIAALIAFERIKMSRVFPTKQFILAVALASGPYILLLTYLYITQSFGEMKEQALSFNTLFYSQFYTSAPTTPIDAVASIAQGFTQSLKDSISFQGGAHPQPLSFLFSATLVSAVTILFMFKKYITGTIFFIVIVLSASRFGFSSTFSNDGQARSGMILSYIGILCIVLVMKYLIDTTASKFQFRNVLLVFMCVTIGYILLSSGGLMASTARDYRQGNSLVKPKAEPGSAATVINIVNRPGDYYWLGPIDFSSQLFIKSKNVSEYRFYAPWHGVCQECTKELVSDIKTNQPNVISFNTNLSIWGHSVDSYSQPLRSTYEDNYYSVSDPRLVHYRFLKQNQAVINERLQKAGYTL